MAKATATATRPLIELHMEADEKGEVTPVIPATWTFSDELVDKLAENSFGNPYIVIVVGYEDIKKNYADEDRHELHATKVYVRKLGDSSPKEYIQFSKPGTNVVMAFVIAIQTKEDEREITQWLRSPRSMSFEYEDETKRYELNVPHVWHESRFEIASFRHDVIVPKEMFAPDPPKFMKPLVRQYFPNSEFDQCDFRRRFLISLALSVPVQFYGIFARVFSLLYAILFAKRGMSVRNFFALNPHDFGHGLDKSFWYYKVENGFNPRRTSALKWLSPPQLILYVLMIAGALVPGLVVAFVGHLVSKGHDVVLYVFTFGDVLICALITDPIIALIVALIFFFVSRKGSRIRRDWVSKHTKAKDQTVYIAPSTFDLLRQQAFAGAELTPDTLANKTIRLKFLDLKMRVCKPFARA
jgi:hypothetical protein